MFRVASIIAVILFGTSTGCRSVPPTPVADYRSGNGAKGKTPIATAQQPESGVGLVAFVQEVEAIDETQARPDPPEVVPSGSPDARTDAPLTLTGLEAIALRNHPTLAAAAARMDMARGRQVQAGLYPNPVLERGFNSSFQ